MKPPASAAAVQLTPIIHTQQHARHGIRYAQLPTNGAAQALLKPALFYKNCDVDYPPEYRLALSRRGQSTPANKRDRREAECSQWENAHENFCWQQTFLLPILVQTLAIRNFIRKYLANCVSLSIGTGIALAIKTITAPENRTLQHNDIYLPFADHSR